MRPVTRPPGLGNLHGLLLRRDHHAHLHYFTKETALRTLTDVGWDWLTSVDLDPQ
jgi:hypothetical protein